MVQVLMKYTTTARTSPRHDVPSNISDGYTISFHVCSQVTMLLLEEIGTKSNIKSITILLQKIPEVLALQLC